MRADLAGLASSAAVVPAAPASGVNAARKRLAWSGAALGLARRLPDRDVPPRPASDAPRAATVIRSIAVLPLDNYPGDPNEDYFAEGMTDELTANLATISQLRVISRGSASNSKARIDRRRLRLPRRSTSTRSWKVRCRDPATRCGSRRS